MSTIPADDPSRSLTLSQADDPTLPHVGVAGDTYTILVMGKDTGGRYCLIDMYVPPGGGPPPHRHDFEESLTVLEGEVEEQIGTGSATPVLLFAGWSGRTFP
jgi:quercetin dioxygenase-like cupin family protein